LLELDIQLKWEQNHQPNRKKLFQSSSRTYAVKWQFWAENQPSGKLARFDTQGTKHAVHSYLGTRTTAQTEYVMGCTAVNNLLKL
jgi:hypothetical protein